jgi:hypothetical protein
LKALGLADRITDVEPRQMPKERSMAVDSVLVLSIDWELEIQRSDPSREQCLDTLRPQLLAILNRYQIPATWAVADPRMSVATESILAAAPGHEIAVLGDRSWMGPGAGRARLARELFRRFDAARHAGISVHTLATRNVASVADTDLLIAHEVRAIRNPPVATPADARRLAPAPLRYGIWQAPVAIATPGPQAWWLPENWPLQREINRTISRQGTLHLAIDAVQLVDRGSRWLAILEAVLKHAAARRDAGKLAIRTIGQLADQALAARGSVPTRSILRPAA